MFSKQMSSGRLCLGGRGLLLYIRAWVQIRKENRKKGTKSSFYKCFFLSKEHRDNVHRMHRFVSSCTLIVRCQNFRVISSLTDRNSFFPMFNVKPKNWKNLNWAFLLHRKKENTMEARKISDSFYFHFKTFSRLRIVFTTEISQISTSERLMEKQKRY